MIEVPDKLRPEEKRANVEEQARSLYERWMHRTGANTPFDRLPSNELMAWMEIGALTTDSADPNCIKCGGPMRCLRKCGEKT